MFFLFPSIHPSPLSPLTASHGLAQPQMMELMQRVRDSRTAQARRQALQRVAYASVVQEESVPRFSMNFATNWWFLKPKRALRPKVSYTSEKGG